MTLVGEKGKLLVSVKLELPAGEIKVVEVRQGFGTSVDFWGGDNYETVTRQMSVSADDAEKRIQEMEANAKANGLKFAALDHRTMTWFGSHAGLDWHLDN